ncbi:hypothetical protein JTE90_024541 [Oedothorax gibbosus]|uniref:Uncharacterized protein n=1 Tax=Oedothorax gibbosus TaxID=931172 RepID=A0AAV6VC59_9ARAC|nr:hypothetical protein JTE90_024541 [Oedothorax gibbosus]
MFLKVQSTIIQEEHEEYITTNNKERNYKSSSILESFLNLSLHLQQERNFQTKGRRATRPFLEKPKFQPNPDGGHLVFTNPPRSIKKQKSHCVWMTLGNSCRLFFPFLQGTYTTISTSTFSDVIPD